MATDPKTSVPRSHIHFAEKDQALREDVHRLGELVGELVYEQAGEALFDLVEAARRAAINRREGNATSQRELQEIIDALAPSSARDFIRAFSTYFQMVNMAEKVHRIRRRREYLSNPNKRQPYSFPESAARLRDLGLSADAVAEALGEISIDLVFTAHPSEVTRRTLLRKQQNIAKHLIGLLDPWQTPTEIDAALGQIRLEMTTGWQTAEYSYERQLSDEAEHVLFFMTDVLYRMIPPFYENLEHAIASAFEIGDRRVRVPEVIRFSSLVGGDMAGNELVTAKSVRETLGRQRMLILDLYYKECAQLARHLSQTEGRCSFSPELFERIEEYRGHFSSASIRLPLRHSRMPYRVFLRLIQARLQATYDDAAFPYESPREFIEDLELIASSLRAHQGRHAGLFALRRFLRRAETFQFHLATLDIRQNASVHRRAVGEALGEEDWVSLDADTRADRVRAAIERRVSPLRALSSEARRTLSAFQTIAHCRRRFGKRSIGLYIIRDVHAIDDMLSMLLLARWGHLGPKTGDIPLDLTPLFETAEELEAAPQILENLLRDRDYRAHLRSREDRQYLMLGYATSKRDGDIVSSRWNLDRAYRELSGVVAKHGVELIVFHGIGGALSRAGGPMHEALEGLSDEVLQGELRVTEHGESVNTRYGLRGIAMRSLEQVVSAILMRKTAAPAQSQPSTDREAVMNAIAHSSAKAFEELTTCEGFEEYFRAATPVDVIMKLGSGAAVGSAQASPVDGVHETAWSLSWTQSRCMLPNWYGFGTGVLAAIEEFGIDCLRELYAHWPLMRRLTKDVEIALAKSDLEIAAEYATLAEPEHQHFYAAISREFDACIEAVLAVRQQEQLLEKATTMARSIQLRNPYVDPMSFLQVHLLRSWRGAGSGEDAELQALMASVSGIAHALQDAG
jgi:phosphoenolpyruvate carboxylase